MNIGIIGPLDSCNKIADVMKKHFPKLRPKLYEVSKTEEAYLEIDQCEKECAGLIFTGMGVYYKTIEKKDLTKPHVYIPFLSSSIMRVLWELKEKYPGYNKVSIDVVNKLDIEDVLKDLELDLEYNLLEYNHLYPEQRYLDFHMDAQEENDKIVSITGLGWVYEEVKKLGYPVIRLYSTRSVIKDSINQLLFKINEARVKHANMAVQLIYVKSQEDISQYKKLEISSLIESSLIGYLKEIQGSIFSINWNKYLIFSTRGAIENLQNIGRLKNILDYLKKKDIEIYVGTGLGITAYESEMNAEKALNAAMEQGYSCIFKVDDDLIEGPLLEEGELSYNFILNKEEIDRLSEMIDLSPIYIQKLSSIKEKYGKDTFTSDELAKYLDVSIRTANRIIKKILDSKFGEEVGFETNKTVGRPKKIVKINFYLE